MTDQTDTSAHGPSGLSSLELIYVLAPLYRRVLAAGITELRIEYEAKDDIGEVRCQARNAFAQIVSSSDELTDNVVAFVLMLVGLRYPNWSLGAGGYGRIDWNLTRNDLCHKHHQRTVTVKTTEHRGL